MARYRRPWPHPGAPARSTLRLGAEARAASRAVLLVAAAGVALAASGAVAQTPEYQPQIGQPGKDVVWVPTPEPLVERMLAMAQVGPRDVVYDLGSGDGRTVIAAAKRGARAVGVEFNPDMVALSRRNAERERLPSEKARFIQGDLFETDFSSATVVTLYLLQDLNMRLRPTLLDMRPGTRIVSHQFKMEDWEPDETSYMDSRPAYLWIVPAKVQGTWRIELPGGRTVEIDLEQAFQKISGTLDLGEVRGGLREATLCGDAVCLSFVDGRAVLYELDGRVAGDRMEGAFQAGGKKGRWTATRRTVTP
jgi:SAM-dependent methyltransferase